MLIIFGSITKRWTSFLLPSRSEGFSLALLEAAAAKLPLIASNIPGNNEFIDDGKNGLLFEIENSNQFAEKINKLAENKSLSSQLSENAYKSVMSNYLVKHFGERLGEFVNKIVI